LQQIQSIDLVFNRLISLKSSEVKWNQPIDLKINLLNFVIVWL